MASNRYQLSLPSRRRRPSRQPARGLLLIAASLLLSAAPLSSVEAPAAAASRDWPSFRGPQASGVSDGQNLPDTWSGEGMVNVRWKTPIPGLAHSSPIVWGDRVFVSTAVSERSDPEFQPGLYGSGHTAADRTVAHDFKVYCLDKATGMVLWERTAHRGAPKSGRHIKSTYANPTPATDGRRLVVSFGSDGLYAFDLDGKLLWQRDLGIIETSAYNMPGYEWGMASSPILWQDRVIVQVDTSREDYLAALDASTGKTVWQVSRDELPSWATPNVYDGPTGAELVTNAPNRIRGYDPATGRELWTLAGSSQITAPTPVFSDGLIVVASGRRPVKPIFAVRAGSRGDLSLKEGETASPSIAWSKTGRGSYMPTPLLYQGRLYSVNNDGVFDAYDLATGAEVYRERLPHRGQGFSGSPVAADGKLYVPSEDGDVFVVRSGPKFEVIAANPMGEVLMTTPALSEGLLILKTRQHVWAVGEAAKVAAVAPGGDPRQPPCSPACPKANQPPR
jgi:outer membrane protein assembly factor BamB